MKNILVLITTLFAATCLCAQPERPKLVVGIIVDQMRQEYLLRFTEHFGTGGFQRLIENGFALRNAHYNYMPTTTGPGHSSVYTGSTPRTHGVISNSWYSRELKRMVYCAEDRSVYAVGGTTDNGFISARNLLSSTITDELELFTQQRAKVVGVAIKDRGSALPAGHMSDGAYWYDDQTGNFMTSSYYRETLPAWVESFNKQKLADGYLNRTWDTSKPIEAYQNSRADDNSYEGLFIGKETPTFPYDLKKLRKSNGNFEMLPGTPYGNSITTDFALDAISGEMLGGDEVTDFLAISYSSTDYVGHQFGPFSKEIEDTYIKLDKEIERLLAALDEKVGAGEYLVFLTADHAVAEVPNYIRDLGLPSGLFRYKEYADQLNHALNKRYGPGEWLENESTDQLFLNRGLIRSKSLSLVEIQQFVANTVLDFDGISEAYTGYSMMHEEYGSGIRKALQLGYNAKRSGDVLLVYEPNWISSNYTTGTTHLSSYAYDTHVPVIFYGWNIAAGETVKRYEITDIVPTLSMLIKIKLPNSAFGEPIIEIFDKKK